MQAMQVKDMIEMIRIAPASNRRCRTCGKSLDKDHKVYCSVRCRYPDKFKDEDPPNPAYTSKKIYVVDSKKVIRGLEVLRDQGIKKLTLEQFIEIFGIRDRNSAILLLGKLIEKGVIRVNFNIKS